MIPTCLLPKPKPALAHAGEITRSFDARDWARHFVAYAKEYSGLATDEEAMTTWFANAIMRGWDEAWRRELKAIEEKIASRTEAGKTTTPISLQAMYNAHVNAKLETITFGGPYDRAAPPSSPDEIAAHDAELRRLGLYVPDRA